MNTNYSDFDEEEGKSLGEYLTILRRRRNFFIYPALITFVIVALVAALLPATYRSTAVILIEEQSIPREMIQSTITSFAAQQIQVITQRIMTVDTIVDLSQTLGLYQPAEGESDIPRTEMAEKFNEDMSLDLVSAEVIDPRSGRPTEATIAFTLSFDNGSATTAQKTTNELVTLYIDENLRTRTERAATTSDFLDSEAQLLERELEELEARLADFKEQYKGSLPELNAFNLSALERTDRELLDLSTRLQAVNTRRVELASELTLLFPNASIDLPGGGVVLNDAERLRALESEYNGLSAGWTEDHPTLLSLKRQIDTLKQKIAGGEANSQAPDNPAYVLLNSQIQSLAVEAVGLEEKARELRDKKQRYETYILKAPEVEKNYQALLRDYDNANHKYQEIKINQRSAVLAENLEEGRQGERFTLVEPPSLPATPHSPNRLAILMMGFILAGGAGLGGVFLREALDGAIYDEKVLVAETGVTPLVVIPYIDNDSDSQRRKRQIKVIAGIAIATIIFILLFVHFFVKPIDVLFYSSLNRVG